MIKNIILTPSFKEGKEVVVLDAAVLLEADWQHFCHEVRTLSINLSLPLQPGVGVCLASRRGCHTNHGSGWEKQGGGRAESSEPTFKHRAGFAGEHCALHPMAARGDSEAGGGGGAEVAEGVEHRGDQLEEL